MRRGCCQCRSDAVIIGSSNSVSVGETVLLRLSVSLSRSKEQRCLCSSCHLRGLGARLGMAIDLSSLALEGKSQREMEFSDSSYKSGLV